MITYVELTPTWFNVKRDGELIGQISKGKRDLLWTYSPDTNREKVVRFKSLELAKAYVEAQ